MSRADAIPNHPGHITLSHWSNGDPAGSGGPPIADAVMTIAWVKGYFNVADGGGDCHADPGSANGNRTCSVPDAIGPPGDEAGGGTWFTTGGAMNASGGSTTSASSGTANRTAAKKGLGAQITASIMSFFALAAGMVYLGFA